MPSNNVGSGRSYRTSLRDDEAFNQLPRELRDALNNAMFDWSAAWVWQRWRKGMGVQQLILSIQLSDKEKARVDEVKVWSRPTSGGLVFEEL